MLPLHFLCLIIVHIRCVTVTSTTCLSLATFLRASTRALLDLHLNPIYCMLPMACNWASAVDVGCPADEIVEIDITNDLRRMAAHDSEHSSGSEEEWVEDDSLIVNDLDRPEPGQVDIRCYFRPSPKEDIRIYFKPVLGPERPIHTYRPKLSVAVPTTKANPNTSQRSGRLASRTRRSASLKLKTAEQKDRDMRDAKQPMGTLKGPRREHAWPATVQGWHPTWADQGLHALAAPISPRVLEVVDSTLLPGPLKPMDSVRHSPASSGGDTLVNGRIESYSHDNSVYGTLPALPIRLAKPDNFNVASSPVNLGEKFYIGGDGINPASAYASSEALPTESRPSGPSALQLWAQEQRRLAPKKVHNAPKSFPKRSRSVFRTGKNSDAAIDTTRKLLERHRQEDCQFQPLQALQIELYADFLLVMHMTPSKTNELLLQYSPAESAAGETVANARGYTQSPASRQAAMVVRAASSETLRQGKMVMTELPLSVALASATATATEKTKAQKKKKRGKLIRIMEAYSKNVEGIQMIQ